MEHNLMTDDIVTRLRELELILMCNGADGHGFLIKHAADEIERLRLILTHICDVWGSDLLSIIEEMNRFKKEIK